MKKLSLGLAVLLAVSVVSSVGQTAAGKRFELGASAGYYSFNYDDAEAGWVSYLDIPIRFGFYIWRGLEFEPEFQAFIRTNADRSETTYFIHGKLLYNFGLGGAFFPFLGGGAGIGNGIPIIDLIEGWGTVSKSFAFTGLAGFRYMIGNSAALRLEYRFNRFGWTTPWMPEGEEDRANLHNILFGVSLFF